MDGINVLLPMKGHSERVPNKNLKEFAGIPLYHAIMEKINNSKYVDTVYINTDSKEIKDDVQSNFSNVVIIDRPESIQGDHVSMNKIIGYDLSQIDGNYFLQTHSTNPLLQTETLDKAISFYFDNLEENDSVFSVTEWQTRLYWKDGKPINHNPSELIRTQDLTPVFEENSNFYIFSKESYNNAGNKRIGLDPYMYPVNQLESIDIDEPEDFKLAELLYENFNK
ncbi:acylneuraminate cytidylyltransferase family protein [Fodinibius sp. AD559]|uniref:acylneuraminate cytidylyltransferase family protein n=1 Tax=Fodinibius sp. AD559 TaxID=3424179 RepID=UPI004046E668